MKNDNKNMTEGSIIRKIILFSLPLILTGVLQQLYNTFDAVIIGQFSIKEALGAVSGTGSIVNIIINLFVGLSMGSSILVSQYFGARDDKSIHKSVHTAFSIAILSGIIIMIVGTLLVTPILKAINTPPEMFTYSKKYLTIIFLGAIPNLLYNFLAGILRATGDSKRPLYYLIISSIINILINLLLVVVFKMDVAGVAIATVISQIVSCLLALHRLTTINTAYKINLKSICLDNVIVKKILYLGIPMGINGMIFSISNLILQSSINSFGSSAIAGCGADMQIECFIYMPMNAIGLAATTFVGQNLGARKIKRIESGIVFSFFYVTIFSFILGLLTFTFGKQLLSLFSSDKTVIEFGFERMKVVSITYFLCGILEVLNGSVRGLGKSLEPMLISIFGICGIRILWIYLIFPYKHTITNLFLNYPISWTITDIILVVLLYSLKRKNIQEQS